ncbi:ABC transporter permease [Gryllotalpicola koreensis]|uniref:ABC transporter permease n=1 Tax=Gryllotalpicola koreensis TaxID=993086 RepID=A0ABP7ZW56_9MICO
MTTVTLKRRGAWLDRMPIAKQVRQSVGVQRFMLVTGIVITAVFVLVAIFAPLLAPYGFAQLRDANGIFPRQAAPSAAHPWGTTVAGYDVLSRTLWASQTALLAIIVAVVLSLILGVLLGLLSGYFGGPLDRVLVVVCDAIYAFPTLLLAIIVSIMISHGQSGLWNGVFAAGISITVVYIPQYFRVVRAEVVRIKAEAYVESAKVLGTSNARIIFRHVLRNSVRTLPLIITLNGTDAFETLAGLGFLGLGIEPTSAAEWGYDLQKAVADVTSGIWWTALYPGLAIVLLALGISLMGESLNDLADPRLRRRGAASEVTEAEAEEVAS